MKWKPSNFKGDYDLNSLLLELELVICGESQSMNLEGVIKVIQPHEKGELIKKQPPEVFCKKRCS